MSQHNTDHLKDEFMRRAGMAEGGSVAHFAIGGQEKSRNWLKGSVENVLEPLMSHTRMTGGKQSPAEAIKELERTYPADVLDRMSEETKGQVHRAMQDLQRKEAMNQWVQRNLANYIRKHMATHDDPIRKLAEEGIIHMPTEQVGMNRHQARRVREKLGHPQLGKSEAAQAWEDAADVSMHPYTIEDIMKAKEAGGPFNQKWLEPWMEKADPKTKVYNALDNMHAHYLGFDHLVDILKEDLAEGRIRPEQLSKISIEHAVRRAHDYDQEKKRKMAETALKATEGMPVHAEYPEGYKWLELTLPKNAKSEDDGFGNMSTPGYNELESALKYEGDTMGHCVGGYCPEVASGNTRIFSLRDAKNEPHVTIEVQPGDITPFDLPKDIYDEYRRHMAQGISAHGGRPRAADWLKHFHPDVYEQIAPAPHIKQIKGKQNQKPKKEYIKYVQDFIKRGKWSDIGDLHNADLIKPTPHYLNQFYGPEDRPFIHAMEQKHGKDYWHPETIGEEYRAWNAKNKTGMADGGSAAAQEAKAKLDQLKQEFMQLAERDRRAAQAVWNAEQMAKPTGKKKGGNVSTDGMRYALTMKRGKKHG